MLKFRSKSSDGADSTARPKEADRLRVFVSYARSDSSDFAEYMVAALKADGFDAFLDRHDIAKAEDWALRINELIKQSDTVVFLISPASIRSRRCSDEVKLTIDLGKRLIPVQWIAVPEAEVPAELKRRNYTIFASGQPFSVPMAELADALRQDLGWLRLRTRLGQEAERWQASARDPDILLRGAALREASDWVKQRKPDAQEIPPLLTTFIGACEEAQAARETEERRELEERATLVASAEVAQRSRKRVLAWLGALVVVGFVVTGWQYLDTVDRVTQLLLTKSRLAATLGQYERAMRYALASMPPRGAILGKARPDSETELANAVSLSRLIRVLGGAEARFESAQFSPDGSLILTRSRQAREAVIWDAQTGAPLHILKGHGDEVTSTSFMIETGHALTMAKDNRVRIWDPRTGAPTAVIGSPDVPLKRYASSRDGTRIATWAVTQPVRVWDVATQRQIGRPIDLKPAENDVMLLSPDGRRMASSVGSKPLVNLWNTDTSTRIGQSLVFDERPFMAFARAGARLLVAGRTDSDRKLFLLDSDTGDLMAEIVERGSLLNGGLSPDGGRVAIVGWRDGSLRLWDARTGRQTGTLKGGSGRIVDWEFYKDGGKIVTIGSDHTARLWDTASSEAIKQPLELQRGITIAYLDPADKYVVMKGSSSTIQVWEPETGRSYRIDAKYNDPLISFGNSGTNIVVNRRDREAVSAWELESGTQLAAFSLPASTGFSILTKGTLVLSRDTNTGRVQLWDTSKRSDLQAEATKQQPEILGRPASADRHVASNGDDNLIRVWSMKEMKERGAVILPGTERENILGLSHDGRRLASGEGGQVAVWDVGSRSKIATVTVPDANFDTGIFTSSAARLLLVDRPRRLALWDVGADAPTWVRQTVQSMHAWAISKSGERVAYALDDGTLVMIEASSQKVVAQSERPEKFSNGLMFDNDGRRLLWWGRRNEALLVDADTLKPLTTFKASPLETAWVLHASFSHDGERVLTTTDDDRMLRIWAAATGRQIGRDMPHGAGILDARFSRDGSRVITATSDGRVRVWEVATGTTLTTIDAHNAVADSLTTFFADFNEDMTEAITAANDGLIRIWNIAQMTLRGPALHARVCGEALRGAMVFTQEDMEDLRSESFRHPCDRYGLLSLEWWKGLPRRWVGLLSALARP